jgi:predicted AlkP superfamily phosphohydrolase/phosphomutase
MTHPMKQIGTQHRPDRRQFHAALAGAAQVCIAALALAWPSLCAQTPAKGRVIVLGFDGADARTTRELIEKGELPNLKRLADTGTFAPLGTSNPAESPVSWAALNSGQNPAKTGVPGFVRRELVSFGSAGKLPSPNFGHLVGPVQAPLESFGNTPIPTWSPLACGAAAGLAVLLGFLVVFAALLRLRKVASFSLSLVLGAIAFWGGWTLRNYLPAKVPKWENPLAAAPFWETAAKAGVPCVVLDGAQSFDRTPVPGARVLAGLGVPDARGGVNSFFVYTSDELTFEREPKGKSTDSGGIVYRVDERDGVIESKLFGPVNFWEQGKIRAELEKVKAARDDLNVRYQRSRELIEEQGEIEARLKPYNKGEAEGRAWVPLRVQRKGDVAAVTLGSQTQELREGQWSDWYHLTFELNPLLKVKAITRAKLVHSSSPCFELYVNALEYDPAAPPFWQPISQPAGYATQLEHACGPFETIGWACMNLPLKDRVVDPVTFLEDIEFTLRWREKLTHEELARKDWRILMSCESTPDRVQHMLYQYYDPSHPMYDAQAAAEKLTFGGREITLAEAIPASYREMDRFVGDVLKELAPEDTLIVCSDHGFQSFRRQVHLNNWLIEKGYLVLKAEVEKGKSDNLNSYADWSRTRAYSLGLGMIYVNQKGREGQGIVDAAEVPALLAKIREDFLASTDPKNGERFGHGAYVVSEIHKGPHLDREADMLVCFNAGWRVSWGTTEGGFFATMDGEGRVVPGETCVDNAKNWSGDHVSVDPSLVEGIFFSNRKLALPATGINLLHIAPTVLALSGVAVPAEYDLPPLELQR